MTCGHMSDKKDACPHDCPDSKKLVHETEAETVESEPEEEADI